MVLSAKNALGRVPRLNEDLLDIKTNYFDKGHPFWIALDEYDRVVGCIGTKCDADGNLFLSHLYVKFDFKRHGIGSKLLEIAEESAKERGYKEVHVHLGKEYLESHGLACWPLQHSLWGHAARIGRLKSMAKR